MENRDQQMAYRALKMRKLEKEILLLDKQLIWPRRKTQVFFSFLLYVKAIFDWRYTKHLLCNTTEMENDN